MYYAKAMLRDTLKVVEIEAIDFINKHIVYNALSDWGFKYETVYFDNVVWLECNSRPIIK